MFKLKSAMRRSAACLRCDFARREDGSVAIETMIMLPVMFWALLSGFAIHDAFRNYGLHQKAAYSIGDAISRETVPIDDEYFSGMRSTFEYLAHSQGQTDMRISEFLYDKVAGEYKLFWSEVLGGVEVLTQAEVKNWHHKLPMMMDNERITLLETWSDYDAPFNTGLTNDEIRTFVFTSARYAPGVCYQGYDCN